MKEDIITVKELKEEIFKIEGVRVSITINGEYVADSRYVRNYPYTEPVHNDKPVSELQRRIKKCIDNISVIYVNCQ